MCRSNRHKVRRQNLRGHRADRTITSYRAIIILVVIAIVITLLCVAITAATALFRVPLAAAPRLTKSAMSAPY